MTWFLTHPEIIRTSAFHHFIPPAEISRPIQQFAQLPGALSAAHASSPTPTDHDRLEIAITIVWNR
jgi:hypothetical protein